MSKKAKQSIKDFVLTLLILAATFGISMLMQNVLGIAEHITTLFVFAVFIISFITNGVLYGIIATVVSVITINYAFTAPFFHMDFSVRASIFSAIVMLIISFSTGTLTTKLKSWQAMQAESEKLDTIFLGYNEKFSDTSDDLVIDYEARQVFIADREIKLTQTEYNIVAFLSDHCGKMMTYASIIKAVWRESPDDASIKKLQVNMANIRKKFGAHPGEISYIVNELGIGYRMKG